MALQRSVFFFFTPKLKSNTHTQKKTKTNLTSSLWRGTENVHRNIPFKSFQSNDQIKWFVQNILSLLQSKFSKPTDLKIDILQIVQCYTWKFSQYITAQLCLFQAFQIIRIFNHLASHLIYLVTENRVYLCWR